MPIVSLHPPPGHPVLRFESKRKNKMSITCEAVSTTKPDNHNLTMGYTWFKNDVFYGNGKRLYDNEVDITYKAALIVCVATDDPDCKTVLIDLTAASTINVVTEDRRCTNVLGVSKPFNVQPLYGPYSIKLQPDRGHIKPIVGSDLSVNCTSDCNPPCDIKWYKDGDVLSNNKHINIPDPQEDDDGLYMCIVDNTYGNRNMSFNVKFERKEGPSNEPPNKQPSEPLNKLPSEPSNDDNIIWFLYIGLPVFIITMIIVIVTTLFAYNKKRKAAITIPIPSNSDMIVADWPQPDESMGYVFTNRIYQGGSNN
ncbi:uncharacterized protein LOC126830318 isoform X2 [Patella vulgata]|nr:uncharacterized protein LOC126830318 isoform X2 [Patella vulgata]